MNIAGAQLSDISLDGAREKLEEIIDDMEKEGALG